MEEYEGVRRCMEEYEGGRRGMKVYGGVRRCMKGYVGELLIYGSGVSFYPYMESALYVG